MPFKVCSARTAFERIFAFVGAFLRIFLLSSRRRVHGGGAFFGLLAAVALVLCVGRRLVGSFGSTAMGRRWRWWVGSFGGTAMGRG